MDKQDTNPEAEQPTAKKKFSIIAVGLLAVIGAVTIMVLIISLAGKYLSISTTRYIPLIPSLSSFFQSDERELNQIRQDLDSFTADELLLDELEQTYSDVLDENLVVTTENALNLDDINAEASGADISGDITAFAEDDAALDALNLSFEEVLQ